MSKQMPIDPVRVEENWSVAVLPDGSKLRVKLVFTNITKQLSDDGKPEYDAAGKPIYNYQVALTTDLQVPAIALNPNMKAGAR